MDDYDKQSIIDGYVFACTCGERYKTSSAAWCCRKCLKYLMTSDYYERCVVDIRTITRVPRGDA